MERRYLPGVSLIVVAAHVRARSALCGWGLRMRSRTDSRLCTKSKAAADAAVWIARPNVMTELRPRRLHGMPGMVPWKGRFRFVAFVIERQIAFDFFIQLSRVFVETFVTSAIRSCVILVGTPLFCIRLLRVIFAPIFFFFSCWIHSFCHFMRTAGCRDTADNCLTATPIGPPIAVPRAAPVTAPPAASTPVPTGCTSSSPVIGAAFSPFFLSFRRLQYRCTLVREWARQRMGRSGWEERSNVTPKVRQSDGLVPWRASAS